MLELSSRSFDALLQDSDRQAAIRLASAMQRLHADWAQQTGTADLLDLARQVVVFCRRFALPSLASRQNIMSCVVECHFRFEVTLFQDILLRRIGFSEASRVAAFVEDLRRGSLVQLVSSHHIGLV